VIPDDALGKPFPANFVGSASQAYGSAALDRTDRIGSGILLPGDLAKREGHRGVAFVLDIMSLFRFFAASSARHLSC
jgi:hypothetical protein